MTKNNGAISIFALLAMMFFLIFIMVAYNNVTQKAKTQVETEAVLSDYYKPVQTALEFSNAQYGGDSIKLSDLKTREQKLEVLKSSNNKYIYSNGYFYKIDNNKKEYQQVQYIETTGSQYFMIGIVPDNTSRIIIDCDPNDTPTSDHWIFGSRIGYGKDAFSIVVTSNGYALRVGTGKSTTSIAYETSNQRHIIDLSGTAFIIDDTEVLSYNNSIQNANTNEFCLFALNEERYYMVEWIPWKNIWSKILYG